VGSKTPENVRGHLVITAPTGGSTGVIPAVVYSLGAGGAKLPEDKIRNELLVGAVLCYQRLRCDQGMAACRTAPNGLD